MRISEIDVERGKVILHTPDVAEMFKFRATFEPDENYTLVKEKKKRSLDANAYAWVMINKIANKVMLTPEQVYRQQIKDLKPKVDVQIVKTIAVDDYRRAWSKNHIGRDIKVLSEDVVVGDEDDWSLVQVQYGSSDYDTKEMSKFIECILAECDALGIETKPQEYIDALLGKWDEHRIR